MSDNSNVLNDVIAEIKRKSQNGWVTVRTDDLIGALRQVQAHLRNEENHD